jgi:hypothetical protein
LPKTPDGGVERELVGSSLVLHLVFLAVVSHERDAAIRAEPVVGIEPIVLGVFGGVEDDLAAVGVQTVGDFARDRENLLEVVRSPRVPHVDAHRMLVQR